MMLGNPPLTTTLVVVGMVFGASDVVTGLPVCC